MRPSGDNHAIEIGTGSPLAYAVLMCSARATFNRRRNRIDRTCAGDTGKRYNIGKPDSVIDIVGPYDDANTTLFTHLDSSDALNLRLTPDMEQAAAADDRLSFAGSFFLEGFQMEIPVDGGIDLSLTAVANSDITTNIPE
jgi:hypothetical protein